MRRRYHSEVTGRNLLLQCFLEKVHTRKVQTRCLGPLHLELAVNQMREHLFNSLLADIGVLISRRARDLCGLVLFEVQRIL